LADRCSRARHLDHPSPDAQRYGDDHKDTQHRFRPGVSDALGDFSAEEGLSRIKQMGDPAWCPGRG
jgi:hypothetical protein